MLKKVLKIVDNACSYVIIAINIINAIGLCFYPRYINSEILGICCSMIALSFALHILCDYYNHKQHKNLNDMQQKGE